MPVTAGETEAQKEEVRGLPGTSQEAVVSLHELGLFGDLLDISGGQMPCRGEGRRAIQPHLDL